MLNLPLIDRGFVLHRKAHGQEGPVRGSRSRRRTEAFATSAREVLIPT
jgi:hypothetical protein